MNEYDIEIIDPTTGEEITITVNVCVQVADPTVGYSGGYDIESILDSDGMDREDLLDSAALGEIYDAVWERLVEDRVWEY